MRSVTVFRKWTIRVHAAVFAVFTLTGLETMPVAEACSTVALGGLGGPVVAYSFDYEPTGAGMLLVNPGQGTRSSILDGNAAEWPIRHGSVSVNQIGPGMPVAGMNTAGLVMSLMWNSEAVYQTGKALPAVNELEFIQYTLDQAGTVEDALALFDSVRIEGRVPIQYFLADRSGTTAAVMPLAEGFEVHAGDSMPVAALTNTSYREALAHFDKARGDAIAELETEVDPSEDANSLARFFRAALAQKETVLQTTGAAFSVLDRLRHPATRWQVAFDPVEQSILLRTYANNEPLHISLAGLNFQCGAHIMSADMTNLPARDLMSRLQPLETGILERTIMDVFGSLRATAPMARPEIAAYVASGLLGAVRCGT